MHLRPGQEFSICFPIAACKQALVSPYHGVARKRKERMPAHPPFPSSISPHNRSPASRFWLESLSSRACLSFNKSLYREQVGGVLCVYLQVICKHEVLKTPPLNMFCLKGSAHSPSEWEKMQHGKMAHSTHRPGACDKCVHI